MAPEYMEFVSEILFNANLSAEIKLAPTIVEEERKSQTPSPVRKSLL